MTLVPRATGPVELLSDYRKYGHLIQGMDGQHAETLADFAEFCRTVGSKVRLVGRWSSQPRSAPARTRTWCSWR